MSADSFKRQIKARKREKFIDNVIVGAIVGTIGALAVAALITIWTVLFKFAWNYGAVGCVHAAGASLGRISFTTALGAIVALVFVRSVSNNIGRGFHTVSFKKKDKGAN